MSFLILDHVQKTFGTTVAVADMSLHVAQGEFISLLGPSGCGKTTTLRMIAGFETPSAGHIVLNGVDISHTPTNKRNIGMVFQSYALFPNMTVADNIGFGLRVSGTDRHTIASRVAEMLQLIDLVGYGQRYPHQLSGGQQQRVALARALARQPQILLLDEPLSALDAKIRDSLRQEIRTIQRQLGITTIYVTHDQQEAMALSDRIVVMSHGHVAQIGTPHDIYNTPQSTFVASFVGTLNQLTATVIDTQQVQFADFHWQSARPITATPGETVTCAIRPELLRLGDTYHNHCHGEVRDVVFHGATIRIELTVATHTLIVDMFNDRTTPIPERGSHLKVSFPDNALLVLDQDVVAGSATTIQR
ncbi:MAG: ABC transporter ATP-binding protein [Roseiflexaceae bacterium]|jgi:putative spermidine/putrescine transport system ATP-binding protein